MPWQRPPWATIRAPRAEPAPFQTCDNTLTAGGSARRRVHRSEAHRRARRLHRAGDVPLPSLAMPGPQTPRAAPIACIRPEIVGRVSEADRQPAVFATGPFAANATNAGRSSARFRAICRASASRAGRVDQAGSAHSARVQAQGPPVSRTAAGRRRRFPVDGAHAASRRAHPLDRFHLVALRRGVLRAGAHHRLMAWSGL